MDKWRIQVEFQPINPPKPIGYGVIDNGTNRVVAFLSHEQVDKAVMRYCEMRPWCIQEVNTQATRKEIGTFEEAARQAVTKGPVVGVCHHNLCNIILYDPNLLRKEVRGTITSKTSRQRFDKRKKGGANGKRTANSATIKRKARSRR